MAAIDVPLAEATFTYLPLKMTALSQQLCQVINSAQKSINWNPWGTPDPSRKTQNYATAYQRKVSYTARKSQNNINIDK